jgi:OmpA-OmpF porin, OOP family
MKILIIIALLFTTACSVQVIDMAPEPTKQKYDLTDNEGDGVIKARDECPDSNAGAKVDNIGCGKSTLYTRRLKLAVHFDNNSYEVKDKYYPRIKKLADFMNKYTQSKVTIEGHTSSRGTAEHNILLSKNRALAIKDILVNRYDVRSYRIKTVGYGFDRLLVEGTTKKNHQKNRRIVAEVTGSAGVAEMKWTIYSVDEEE